MLVINDMKELLLKMLLKTTNMYLYIPLFLFKTNIILKNVMLLNKIKQKYLYDNNKMFYS